MRRDVCLLISFFCGMTPLMFIIIYATHLDGALTQTDCLLNTKSVGTYNCSGSIQVPTMICTCGPTQIYEFKYIASVVSQVPPIIKEVYGGKNQTCSCHLLAGIYAQIHILQV